MGLRGLNKMNKEEVQNILFNLYRHYTKRYKQCHSMKENLTKHGGQDVGYYNGSVSMIELICDELDIDIDSYAKEIGYKDRQ